MKVLITGGTGTISSGLVEASVKLGHETFAITRGHNPQRNVEDVTYLCADVRNAKEMDCALGGSTFDVIVECLVFDCEQLKVSLNNFADRCTQYVFISTSGVYERNTDGIRITEDTDKNQVQWSYTKGKIDCEQYLERFFVNRKNHYTIIRPVVTYGDYRIPFPIATRTPTWSLFERITQDAPVLACDNVKHSVIHIEDFSTAVVGLFGNPAAYDEDFHISSNGSEIFWDDVIRISGEILGKEPQIIHVPLEMIKVTFPSIYEELKWNKTTELLVDDAKLKNALPSFQSKVNIEDGVMRTIKGAWKEFSEGTCQIDQGWWEACDVTLFAALHSNTISEMEKKIIKTYFKSFERKKYVRVLLKYYKRAFLQWNS